MTRLQLAIFVAGILVVIVAVGVTVGTRVGLEHAFLAALTAALVWVTAFYAYMTSQISRATNQSVTTANRQAEIMLNSEYNAAAPVIELNAAQNDVTKIRIYWNNIGKGPALNFRCWIEDEEHHELRARNKAVLRTAVATGDGSYLAIDTEIGGYKLGVGVGYVRAQYQSIFRQTYESSLHFPTNVAPQLEYRRVENDRDIVIV